MPRALHHQRGISFPAILFLVVVAAVIVTVGLKLGPHYMQYAIVKSVMDKAVADPEVSQSRRGVLEKINNELYINEIRSLTPKDFTFTQVPNGTELSVDYEAREHLFANIDAVVVFSHSVIIPSR
jgi:lipopolysaccharide export LptBFGC system permease protein LptF